MPNYNNLSKQTWRGWAWNRIVERIPKPDRRTAVGLYLVGPEDLDREVTQKKGFQNHNVIAVDINGDYVQRVRDNGGLAIQGRLEDLITVWPEDWPLAFVYADFTCGLAQTAKELQAALMTSRAVQLGKTVVMVNLQRGRDPDSNPVRQAINGALNDYSSVWLASIRRRDKIADMIMDNRHRGKQFVSVFFYHCQKSVTVVDSFTAQQLRQYEKRFLELVNPVFYSYRQDPQTPYMDSTVFTFPSGERGLFNEMLSVYMDIAKRDPRAIKPKIAACRAMRTMKLRGAA